MSLRVVTASQMREIDRLSIEQYGIPGFSLMRRAAEGALKAIEETWGPAAGKRVLVIAGRGNNGGDGMVLACLLAERAAQVRVALIAQPQDLRGDARRAWDELQKNKAVAVTAGADAEFVRTSGRDADWIVDALFGTGLNAPVTGEAAKIIATVNESGKKIVSLDIPSGLDADRGVPLGTSVRAHLTPTFGLAKIGQVIYPGADYVGTLRVVDIGLAAGAVLAVNPRTFLAEPNDFVGTLPARARDAHKGHFGHVLVIGGARGRTGAAVLAAAASARAGAGLTTLAGPASLNAVFASHVPEIMTATLPDRDGRLLFDEQALRSVLEGKSVVVLGPGMGTDEQAFEIVRFVLTQARLPVVLDADGLTCLARQPEILRNCAVQPVLTPHPGEMARLVAASTKDVQQDRPGVARRFAKTYGCILLLKGARTLIAAPDDELWINPTGNPGMATGGMGDVLSGVIGALRAQGLSPLDAARLGAFVHGRAADRLATDYAPFGFLASEVARLVPVVLKDLVR